MYERRKRELTERSRDLVDELLEVYPDGPDSLQMPPFPAQD